MKKTIIFLACVLAIGNTIAQNNTYDEAKRDAESWMYAVSLQDVFFFEDNWSSVLQ